MILEFSQVENAIFKQVYDSFSFHVIPQMGMTYFIVVHLFLNESIYYVLSVLVCMVGKLVANDESSYQYLVESIRRFPSQDELLMLMQKEGFKACSYVNFTMGVCAVHSGFKL